MYGSLKYAIRHLAIISCLALFPVMGAAASPWTIGFLTGSGGLGDESFNDMTYKGIGLAMSELKGVEVAVREWEPFRPMDQLLQQLIAEKPKVIVLNGNQFLPLIRRYAPQHPHIIFIANDFDAGQFINVKSIVYSQHEGAFLAGALAALFSKSGTVGFIGGVDVDAVKAFEHGFVEGVQHVAPSVQMEIKYVSHLPDYSGFNNPQKGKDLATALYKQGADVVFAVAGLSGNGAIRAAKQAAKYVIGVDSDQDHMAKGHVLTSVMKRLDVAVYKEIVKAYKGGCVPGTVWYGLENNGVSLTPMRYTKEIISAETKKRIEELTRQIISGEITVTNTMGSVKDAPEPKALQ